MKQYFFAATVALLFTATATVAQDKKSENADKDSRMKEYDEIVIKRKDADKDTKVVVEIKGDKVFVDGQPIEVFNDKDISVKKRSANRFRMAEPMSPFRMEGGDWLLENDGMPFGEDVAFLGVMTEGSADGAKIEQVTENSAAAKAGLKPGDIITKINDKKVFDHEQLSQAIGDMKPDDKVNITYKRNGKEQTTSATLGKRKSERTMMFRGNPDALRPGMPFNNPQIFEFDTFNASRKPRLGIKAQDTEEGNGVKVLEVEEGSAAAKAGIKENDIITSFEGKNVNSAAELVSASREAREKSTLKVELKRNGKPQTIEVKVPKKLKTANL